MNDIRAKPATEGMRVYQPVWERLKKPPHSVNLEVHPAMLARVRKAISKEKHMDLGFKELNGHRDEDYFYLKFVYNAQSQRLTISLINRYGVDFEHEVSV